MLTTVTITGADDAVHPMDLAVLSREFPFVEWGILYSATRFGTPRYPSGQWLEQLRAVTRGFPSVLALSAHFCGRVARETMAGERRWLNEVRMCRRVQLNGWGPQIGCSGLARVLRSWAAPPTIIAQARSVLHVTEDARELRALLHPVPVEVLYDPSGGRGQRPEAWYTPAMAIEWASIGLAGGINPDNVEDAIAAGPADRPFWIDMESGVRDSDDRLDLTKVRRVLEAAARWVPPRSVAT